MSASPIGARQGVPLIVAAPFRGLAAKSDKRLVELAQRGDTHAIEVLYDRYATAILRYCRSLLRSTQEAEDVQQEVFVTALSALRNGAGPTSFRPWLYRVAHNACISHMRAKRPNLVAVDGEIIASATTEPASEEREELRQLLNDLSALPEVQRGALLLREMDGFSYEQVGEVLGLPVTTVRSTIFRARSTLQGLAEARDAKCEEIQAELSELADRRGRRSRRITSHLHVCAECRDFRAGLRSRPTVLRGYVPALPIGVLASIKATVLGAQAAGGAAAVAGGAGASGGFGVLSGAGASKIVAAAASAAALIGGAGTQVGILGGGSQGVTRGQSATVVVADLPGVEAAKRAAAATGARDAVTVAHSGVAPSALAEGDTSSAAPGAVAWRPADGDVLADDDVHAGHGHGHSRTAHAHSSTIASTGSARHAGTAINGHWGFAQPDATGAGAGSDDDDRSDDGTRSGDRRQRNDDDDSGRSGSRTGSSTNSFASPSGDSDGQTGSREDDDRPSTSGDDSSRQAGPAPEQQSAGGADQTSASGSVTEAPKSDPAPDSPAAAPVSATPPSDPAPSSPAAEPAPASDPAPTTTTPAPPATDASGASTAPAPPADPAPTTP